MFLLRVYVTGVLTAEEGIFFLINKRKNVGKVNARGSRERRENRERKAFDTNRTSLASALCF